MAASRPRATQRPVHRRRAGPRVGAAPRPTASAPRPEQEPGSAPSGEASRAPRTHCPWRRLGGPPAQRLPRSSLGYPGWASEPRSTRSGGCALTPPWITWPVCGSRSPAPWGRALGARADACREPGLRLALLCACRRGAGGEPAAGSSGLSFAGTCASSAWSKRGFRDSHAGAG